MIAVRTTIGFGSGKQATEKVHGSPLGDDDIVAVKKLFGFNPEEKFHIPDEVRDLYTNQKQLAKKKKRNGTLSLPNMVGASFTFNLTK